METEVAIVPRQQETQVPEFNAVEKLNGILYRLGKVTSRTHIDHGEASRPISLRTQRAQLYHEVRGISRAVDKIRGLRKLSDEDKTTHVNSLREQQKTIFAEAHARDEIALDYLNQGEIRVTLPGLGEQTAKYTMIEPPESRKTLEQSGKPPIFLIPGISNDIDAVGALTQEIPYQGRSVIVVAFPDSFMGSVTKEFADAVGESSTYEPHAAFYKAALQELLGKDAPVELWGFSTGAPIAAEILSDPEMQKVTTDAVFLSPAGTAEQTAMQLNTGTIKETGKLVKKLSTLGKYSFTFGGTDEAPIQSKQHKQLRNKVLGTLMKKVRTKFAGWSKARVQEGGHIVVVSGGQDEMTKSYQADGELEQLPQTSVISLPEGSHTTPLTQPAEVIEQVFARQKELAA